MKNANVVKIAGRVYECKVEKKVTGPASKKPGTEFFAGDLLVAVDEEGLNIIPVHFTYVTEFYGSGKKNTSFDVMSKIVDGATWIVNGKDAALKVEIDASADVNDFVDRNGEVVSPKRVEGSFVRVVDKIRENDTNDFRLDFFINKVTRVEANEERHIPNDYVTVSGYAFNFRNALLPLDLVVKNEDGMNFFEGLDATPTAPVFIYIWGKLNYSSVKTTIEEESAFGSSNVRFVERKIREWIVTGAKKTPYEFDEDSADLKPSEVIKAKQDREVHLAEVKKRDEEYRNSTASETVSTGQFVF